MKLLIAGPSNVGPYHAARFSALAELGWEVHYLALNLAEHDRPWRFVSRDVIVRKLTSKTVVGARREVRHLARQISPDAAVVVGYGQQQLLGATLALQPGSFPLALHLIGTPYRRSVLSWRDLVKRSALMAADVVIAPGRDARSLALTLGVPAEKVSVVGHAVDTTHFSCADRRSDDRPILYVGRFSTEKRLPLLIDGFRRYQTSGGQWTLRLIGDGPLRSDILALVAGDPTISIDDWLGYSELPEAYRHAAYTVLPSSYEPWGLVVNESMACGRPALVSDAVGCAPDLVFPGQTGHTFRSGDAAALEEGMHSMDEMLRSTTDEELGMRCRAIVEAMSPQRWATSVSQALRTVDKT